MGYIILLGILGCVVGGFVGWLIAIIIEDIISSFIEIGFWGGLIGAIILMICGGILGCNIDKHEKSANVEAYIVAKQTIESSVRNTSLSGLERIQLVEQATNYNKSLAKARYDGQQWYGFNIDSRVYEIDFINLDIE